jgi:hypothetical protein
MNRENTKLPTPEQALDSHEKQTAGPSSGLDRLPNGVEHLSRQRRLPGTPISLVLGGLIVVTILAMTLGLLQYEKLSNQAKSIQASWPKTAEKLEEMYRQMDQPLIQANTNGKLSADKLKEWELTRDQFRSLLRWNDQLRAAEDLEIRLNDPIFQSAFESSVGRSSDQWAQWVTSRKLAQERMNQFLCDEMVPYRERMTKFPGTFITLFMKLPEPLSFTFTQWP